MCCPLYTPEAGLNIIKSSKNIINHELSAKTYHYIILNS